MAKVEERLERIERILEDGGIAFLANHEAGPTWVQNVGLRMDPKNLRPLSHLGDLIEALGKSTARRWA